MMSSARRAWERDLYMPWRTFASIVAVLIAAACSRGNARLRPLVVQGAMQIEVDTLTTRLEHATEDRVGQWTFWRGTIDGYPVVVSKTLKGMSNAAAATVIAAQNYQPLAIINQGTAGGHDPDLRLYDIVIGSRSVNLGAFKSPFKAEGFGSHPLEWKPLNLTAADGSAANDKGVGLAGFDGDPALLAVARTVKPSYARGRVVEGVIGSSDLWNDEVDRVLALHRTYGTAVEEMETASAAQVAAQLGIPFLGIRVVSDNVTNGTAWDPKTSEACEDFVLQVVKAHVATLRR
jgi:adenosylhomocysteine nucleosidase